MVLPTTLPPFSTAIRSRCRRRFTLSRTAPPSRVALADPTMTKAASDSRASPVSRTATARESGGAESSTTSENAALRSRTSAHHAALAASCGRIIHTPSARPRCAQSRGASVRDASMNATHSPRCTAASTTWRSSVSLPVAPTISVSRPRGSPSHASAASSFATPVGRPCGSGAGAGRSARSDSSFSSRLALADGASATAVLTNDGSCRVRACHRRNTENMRAMIDPVNG